MYTPHPINTDDVELDPSILALVEQLAENTHEVWAARRMAEGWTYGPARDDASKQNPCLVPYAELPEQEKNYDRDTALSTLKVITAVGYVIRKPDAPDGAGTG